MPRGRKRGRLLLANHILADNLASCPIFGPSNHEMLVPEKAPERVHA